MSINNRARAVLQEVVRVHYQTCEPVGSATISRSPALRVSSATIRNIMVQLERNGYLCQPHTSAGRLPTDLGYRAYVDGLAVSGESLDDRDCNAIAHLVEQAPPKGPEVLRRLAHYIHQRTQLLTFYMPFRHSGIELQHIHFERLSDQKLLVLWVSRGGYHFQTVLSLPPQQLEGTFINRVENYFNEVFHGRNMLAIQQYFARARWERLNSWDPLMETAAQLIESLVKAASEDEDLQYQGMSALLEMPEFRNIESFKTLFSLLESRQRLNRYVHEVLGDQRVMMFLIGHEMRDPDLSHLSLALAKFRVGQHWLGCVGALGPRRMPYLRSMQLLHFAHTCIASRAP